MKISKKEFIGLDVDLEISLNEYGMIATKESHKDGSGSHMFVYIVDEKHFDTAHIYPKNIKGLLDGNDWLSDSEIEAFLDYCDRDLFNINFSDAYDLIDIVSSLVSYYGTENIFGCSYYPYSINEIEFID